jgi:Reverse transcriptase (RNA-dependent DNA polymerase)/Endonuclease-reverse transcriptase
VSKKNGRGVMGGRNRAMEKERSQEISLMVVNCRSLANKVDEFRTLLELYQPEVVVAVETWLGEGFTERELTIDGYTLHRRDRDRHGGGVMVALKTGIQGTLLWTEEEVEMMGIKIVVGGNSIEIIAAYRPPGGDLGLLHCLEDRLNARDDAESLIIAGDLNMPNVNWTTGSTSEGKGVMQNIVTGIVNEGFQQVVEEGTRSKRLGGSSILDVVLVKPRELWARTEVVDGISDHQVPIVSLALAPVRTRNVGKKVWGYRRAKAREVRKAFEDRFEKWCEIDENDVESMWLSFRKIYEEVREKLVPYKVLQGNADPAYYNSTVRKLKRKSRKMSRRLKATQEGKETIRSLRRDLNKAKREAKEKFIGQMFREEDVQGSWNRMYRFVASQKGSGRELPTLVDQAGNEWRTDKEKANALNKFYGDVFNDNDGPDGEGEQIEEEEEKIRLTEGEVWNVLKKLKNGKSPGVDGIQSDLLKLAGRGIVGYLLRLFQASLTTGKLPQDWKEAEVVPISKGGPRGKVDNYRGISLTSDVCKTKERVLIGRVIEKVDERRAISDAQHGFRKGYSCETQLLGFAEELARVVDRGGCIDAVFLDFEKAFDKVDHNILLRKLKTSIGNAELINWIKDFLKDRVQRVRVGSEISCEVKVTSGVPQGSVLGPLLFDLYIDDLNSVVDSKIRLFADDCVLYREISSEDDAVAIQADLTALNNWVQINKMGLNVGKCKVVTFGRKRINADTVYEVGGRMLEAVDNYKYLGVVFDRRLRWGSQVERVSKKGINTLNFVMRQLRGTGREVKEKAYFSLVRPIAEYASSVWDPYRIGEVKDVERIQRIAARRVTGKVRRWRWEVNERGEAVRILESPTEMIKELGWQTMEERRKVDRLCNFFRAMEGEGGWGELYRTIERSESRYEGRRNHGRKVTLNGARSDVGKFSFLNRTGRDWNGLNCSVFEGGEQRVRQFRKKIREVVVKA